MTRFWAKVDMSGGPEACWPWTGSIGSCGYGQINIGGRPLGAHRVAWELTYGLIPPETPVIRHVVCRNPACVNPAHLAAGTYRDNQHDRIADGTSNRGERHGMAKLTHAQAQEIRRRFLTGEARGSIARAFGVSQRTIFAVAAHERWAP